MVSAAIRYLEKQAPGIFNGGRYYYYAHYYAIQAMVQAGDELALDMEAGTLTNERTNTVLQADPPISSVQVEIYRAGGLLKL